MVPSSSAHRPPPASWDSVMITGAQAARRFGGGRHRRHLKRRSLWRTPLHAAPPGRTHRWKIPRKGDGGDNHGSDEKPHSVDESSFAPEMTRIKMVTANQRCNGALRSPRARRLTTDVNKGSSA
ncbi:hypothetical protein KCP75_07310 [Salmonella enterica subsp. enterica]|nr:hypothetical protein KCP75_07310 [Salmonella enterica subsp. enterica]